ncbi:MAG: hypothetical protein RL653_1444, partial [Pseudomonadota bacterium]
MSLALDAARPALLPEAGVSVREDGTAGVHCPRTGRSAELAPDQVPFLGLMDGTRSVTQLLAEHQSAHRGLPVSALDDLLRRLGNEGLLQGVPAPSPSRWRRTLGTWPTGAASWIAGAGVVASLAALWLDRTAVQHFPLGPWALAQAAAGAVLGLLLSRCYAGLALAAFGRPPRALRAEALVLVPVLGPDVEGVVHLPRARRVRIFLLALLGTAVGWAVCLRLGPAWGAGALGVLFLESCPFLPRSGGRLLSALDGRVDFRAHARGYIDRRLLRRAVSRSTFEGEGWLIATSLLSLAWLCAAVRVLLVNGVPGSLRLLAVAVESTGPARVGGAVAALGLLLLVPLALGALGWAVFRALRSLGALPAESAGELLPTGEGDVLPVLFSRLPETEQQALLKSGERRRYPAGATLVAQGAPGDRFFALVEGRARVEREEESGRVRLLARLSAGDAFGELALLSGGEGRRTATVRAETEVTVFTLDRAGFERLRTGLADAQVPQLLRATAALRQSAFFGALPGERLCGLAFRMEARDVSPGDLLA